MGVFDKLAKNEIITEIIKSSIKTCCDIVDEFGLYGTKIYFDERCVYTDEKDLKHHIQFIRLNSGYNIELSVNDEIVDLSYCNIAICTLVEMKMKKYAREFSGKSK